MEVDKLATLVGQAGDDDPLKALYAAAEIRHEAERIEAVQVRRARGRGVPWALIAEALGVSKQAVHKKYGGHPWSKRG
ncbi:hypothetical protein [Allokutzneria oryzae]|uniref:AsnC family protein n=1 Tax=Allokutzneria oryzae TaxID=1378989 RepID=A0ABV5ZRH6_9PSEU